MEDPVSAFLQQWELDTISEKVLRRCSPAVQNDVMAKFKPKDVSRNCNALFMSFVKSLTRDESNYIPPESNGLDPTIVAAPLAPSIGYAGGYPGTTLPPPQPVGQASMMQLALPLPTAYPPPEMAYVPLPTVARTPQAEYFLAQWRLNTEATNFLDSLCGPVQDEVIRDFSQTIVLEEPSQDANIAFLKFARERAAKVFIEQWQLDEQSWTHLLSLPPDTQVLAMASFNPAELTNLNQQFRCFATSCVAVQPMPSVTVDARMLQEFQQRWQLSDQNMAVLQSLDAALQVEIMTAFAPRDLTRDANGMFRSFLNSRRDGPGRYAMQTPYVSAGEASYEYTGGLAPGLDLFVQRWKLDATSVSFITSLPAATQADIMNSFYPKDTARDCNGIFMSFARSRLSGTRSPGLLHGLQAMHSPQLDLGNLDAEKAEDVEKFVLSWALNVASADLLKEASSEIRQMVMSEFRPHDIFRDVNSVFQSFVHSRGHAAPAAKRARYS